MPQGRIQPRIELLNLGSPYLLRQLRPPCCGRSELEQPTAVPPSDSEIRTCIKDVMEQVKIKADDASGVCSMFRSLTNSLKQIQRTILDTTMRLWIEDPRVTDLPRTPVSIQQGTGGNWRQHDIIRAYKIRYNPGGSTMAGAAAHKPAEAGWGCGPGRGRLRPGCDGPLNSGFISSEPVPSLRVFFIPEPFRWPAISAHGAEAHTPRTRGAAPPVRQGSLSFSPEPAEALTCRTRVPATCRACP